MYVCLAIFVMCASNIYCRISNLIFFIFAYRSPPSPFKVRQAIFSGSCITTVYVGYAAGSLFMTAGVREYQYKHHVFAMVTVFSA
jgi:hypothetical protein